MQLETFPQFSVGLLHRTLALFLVAPRDSRSGRKTRAGGDCECPTRCGDGADRPAAAPINRVGGNDFEARVPSLARSGSREGGMDSPAATHDVFETFGDGEGH